MVDRSSSDSPPLNPASFAGVNYNPTYHFAGIVGRYWRLGMNVKF